MKRTRIDPLQRIALAIMAVCVIAIPGSLSAAPLFTIDFNSNPSVSPGAGPTQAGFVGMSLASVTTQTLTNVNSSGIDFTLNTASGDNGRNRGAHFTTTPLNYSDLYQDMAIRVTSFSFTNLAPSTAYDIRVWAYDWGTNGTDGQATATFSVATGVGSGGSITWTTAPTTDNQYSLLMSVTSNASGVIAINETAVATATRLNAVELLLIPEPSIWVLLAGPLGTMLVLRRRHRA